MHKDTIKERKDFLKNKVTPILEPLVAEQILKKPESVVTFMRDWLDSTGVDLEHNVTEMEKKVNMSFYIEYIITILIYFQKLTGFEETSKDSFDDSEEDDVQVDLPAMIAKKNSKPRISVSAESYGQYNQKEEYKPFIVPKSEEAKKRLNTRLSQAFMFSMLDEKEKEIVVGAMRECTYKNGDMVIKQGDDGDCLYVVDKGKLDCRKRFQKDGENVYLKTYVPGEAFGEQSLLYNAPRAASIDAKEDCVQFSLDRDTFNNIVKSSSIKKREQYEKFQTKVSILETLEPYERNKICDVQQVEKFTGYGKYIIKQGEKGSTFYMLVEGTCSAFIKQEDGTEKEVFKYKENDYFGEQALQKDAPRAASIKTTCLQVTVATIDRLAFKRLLGPLEKMLERNVSRYSKELKNLDKKKK